jgi:glucan phosphoethanolaminetransferase (alkaline phosphatase superfamily)
MTIERALRLLAGLMILVSVALTYYVSPWWMLLTIFIGLNLLQSSFTNTCPAVWFLGKLGLKRCVPESK